MYNDRTHLSKRKEREFGADVVRITALFLVLWLHYYLRNGFYYREAANVPGFIALMSRSMLMCCVPLFMVLTGYLKCSKQWNLRYYRSLLPILLSYLIISLIHLPYKIFFQNQQATVGEWFLSFLKFDLATYGWYVSMYIGLFLISPLLNLIWSSCRNQKAHLAVVLTFVALTFLPSSANHTALGNILPSYFQSIYYVTYYLIGCYISTYKPKSSRLLCMLSVLIISALMAWANIATRTKADDFYTGYNIGYNCLGTGVMTTAVFLTLYRCSCEREKIRQAAAHLSGVVFEVYLLSYIADTNIFHLFYKKYPASLYLPVGIVMTLAVFILTYPLALGVNRLVRYIISRLNRWNVEKTANTRFSYQRRRNQHFLMKRSLKEESVLNDGSDPHDAENLPGRSSDRRKTDSAAAAPPAYAGTICPKEQSVL